MTTLTGITVFPLKSGAGVDLDEIEDAGLEKLRQAEAASQTRRTEAQAAYDLALKRGEPDEIDAAGVVFVPDPDLEPGEARISGQWAQADLTYAVAQELLRQQVVS